MIAFIALFQAVANLSIDAIAVRDITRDQDAAPEILGTLLALRLGAGIICWMTVVACVALFSPGDRRVLWMTVIVGGVLVFQASDTVDLWFQSQSQSRRTVAAKLSAYLVSSGLKVLLVLSKAPLEAFALVTVFDAIRVRGRPVDRLPASACGVQPGAAPCRALAICWPRHGLSFSAAYRSPRTTGWIRSW